MTLYDLGGLEIYNQFSPVSHGSMYYNNAIVSIVYFIKTVMCLYSVELNLQ